MESKKVYFRWTENVIFFLFSFDADPDDDDDALLYINKYNTQYIM